MSSFLLGHFVEICDVFVIQWFQRIFQGDIMGNFGIKHLTGLVWLFTLIAVLLVVLLTIKRKHQYGEKFDQRVIAGAALFIWFWEAVKTIVIFNSPLFAGEGVYPAFMLPFHICSMGLYAYWILGFHKGNVVEFIKPFSFATLFLVTLLILTIPDSSGIMGNLPNWSFVEDNILPFQSFLYHGTLVFVPLYMVLSGFYRPHIRDIGKATLTLLITAVFAFGLNKILKVTDFMTLEYGNGNPFQFLLQSNYFLYILVLASIAIAGTSIFLLLGQWLSHRIHR